MVSNEKYWKTKYEKMRWAAYTFRNVLMTYGDYTSMSSKVKKDMGKAERIVFKEPTR